MAIPTITDITPNIGPAGGRTAIKIAGVNFAIPPDPPANTHWAQTVQVLFNGVPAEQVLPYGDDLVACVVPPYLGSFEITDPTTYSVHVNVTLRNLDPDTGLPISGEEVTVTDGWTHTRGAVTDNDVLNWVSEYVGRHMQRQTIDNIVVLAAHPDWDQEQGTYSVEIQKVPAIVLVPRVERRQFLPTERRESGVATRASVTDTTSYPVTAGTGVMKVKIDRQELPQSITFAGTETTAAQIAETIAAQISGATAAESGGQSEIESDTDGGLSFVEVIENPAGNPALTFPTAEQQGVPEEETREIGGVWINVAFDVRGIEHFVGNIEKLADMLVEFVHRSGTIPIPGTIGDPNSAAVLLPVAIVDEPVFPDVPEENALVKEFLATIVVRGVVIGSSGIASLTEDFHSYVGVTDVYLDIEKSAL